MPPVLMPELSLLSPVCDGEGADDELLASAATVVTTVTTPPSCFVEYDVVRTSVGVWVGEDVCADVVDCVLPLLVLLPDCWLPLPLDDCVAVLEVWVA